MSVYNINNEKYHTKCNMFLDEQPLGISRFDKVRYPKLERFTELQLSYFWRPEEVDVSKDRIDYENLSDSEKHIFCAVLSRQILLDSVQGRSPNLAFLPIVTLPELETWIETWSFYETIHSRSYTHILRNVLNDPSKVFDKVNDIEEIIECAADITKHYDELIEYNQAVALNGYTKQRTKYEHKKKLWLAMMAVNILEGIRFYASFACSWSFAEQKKMEGNAKLVKFICRDENLHLGSTQYILSQLTKEDPDFAQIREETEEECTTMFLDAIRQEKEWCDYLFKHGSMMGMTKQLLCEYVDWIGAKRMSAVGYKAPFATSHFNPLPWTEGWISGKDRQVAPQEVEKSEYQIGEISKNIDSDFFGNLEL